MGAHSRRKGAQGERELVSLAQTHGFNEARRTAPMQAFDGDDTYPDVANVGRLWAENKRHRRVNVQAEMRDLLAKERPGYVRVLFHRDDGGPALATLEAAELLKLEAQALGVTPPVNWLDAVEQEEAATPDTAGKDLDQPA